MGEPPEPRSPASSAPGPPRTQGRLVARGADANPANRFERIHVAPDPEFLEQARRDGEQPGPAPTVYLRDPSRTLLAHNQSPDVGFDTSLNPYRGCEHGCVYCFARPNHEYLGFSAGLDFETRILVKTEAPALLRRALSSPRWQPQVIAMSGVTDPYQPGERHFRITRACLAVLAEFRNPVGIVTKSALVERDLDLLAELARHDAAVVNVSITSLDDGLRRKLEPRASSPKRRLEAVERLAAAGVPVGVMVAPIIPGLNDAEIPAIVAAAARAGARRAGIILLRLPHGVAPLFEGWLDRHAPLRKHRVLARVREVRGGRLNDPGFHTRMRGQGTYAEQLHELFRLACRRAGLASGSIPLSTDAFRRPPEPQLSLW